MNSYIILTAGVYPSSRAASCNGTQSSTHPQPSAHPQPLSHLQPATHPPYQTQGSADAQRAGIPKRNPALPPNEQGLFLLGGNVVCLKLVLEMPCQQTNQCMENRSSHLKASTGQRFPCHALLWAAVPIGDKVLKNREQFPMSIHPYVCPSVHPSLHLAGWT